MSFTFSPCELPSIRIQHALPISRSTANRLPTQSFHDLPEASAELLTPSHPHEGAKNRDRNRKSKASFLLLLQWALTPYYSYVHEPDLAPTSVNNNRWAKKIQTILHRGKKGKEGQRPSMIPGKTFGYRSSEEVALLDGLQLGQEQLLHCGCA